LLLQGFMKLYIGLRDCVGQNFLALDTASQQQFCHKDTAAATLDLFSTFNECCSANSNAMDPRAVVSHPAKYERRCTRIIDAVGVSRHMRETTDTVKRCLFSKIDCTEAQHWTYSTIGRLRTASLQLYDLGKERDMLSSTTELMETTSRSQVLASASLFLPTSAPTAAPTPVPTSQPTPPTPEPTAAPTTKVKIQYPARCPQPYVAPGGITSALTSSACCMTGITLQLMKLTVNMDKCKHFSGQHGVTNVDKMDPDCAAELATELAAVPMFAPRCCVWDERLTGDQSLQKPHCKTAIQPFMDHAFTVHDEKTITLKMMVVGCVYGGASTQSQECTNAKRMLRSIVQLGAQSARGLYRRAGERTDALSPLTRKFLLLSTTNEIDRAPGRFWSTRSPTLGPTPAPTEGDQLLIHNTWAPTPYTWSPTPAPPTPTPESPAPTQTPTPAPTPPPTWSAAFKATRQIFDTSQHQWKHKWSDMWSDPRHAHPPVDMATPAPTRTPDNQWAAEMKEVGSGSASLRGDDDGNPWGSD
jgi:hypothetical protein